ncbi:MAG: YfhO family protein [Anaerolineales bacterium]
MLFSPGILSGKAFFWGTILLQFIPWRHIALEIIKSGEIPLWNPYSGMGAPLLANYQSALLYPPSWGLLILEAIGGLGWSAIGQGVFLALHLGFCAVGMKRWLEALGVSSLGQVVGGMAFGLSGYLVSRASFQSILFSASWMPWIFLFTQRLLKSKGEVRRKDRFWLVLSIAMNLLAGHAQTSWYILWTATAWVVWQSLLTEKGCWQERWRVVRWNMLSWGVTVGWAVLIAAAQLLPTGEYLLNSQRSAGIDREIGLTYSFWPWRFLTMWMPNFFGNPAHGNYWGYANYWEDAVYSGSMALLLGIFALGKRLQQSKDQPFDAHDRGVLKAAVLFWWLMGALAMFLALGKNLSFYPWLMDHLPGFDLFQAPTRISLIAQFGLALSAGIGIDLWEKPQGRVLYWTRLGTAGFLSMFIVSSAVYSQNRDFYPTILQSFQQFGGMAFLFGILLLLKPSESLSLPNASNSSFNLLRWWKICVAAFWGIDLIWMGWGLNPVISIDVFTSSLLNPKPLNTLPPSERFFMNAQDEYTVKFERFFRFDTFQNLGDWVSLRQSMLPNLNLLDGWAMVNNFDPFVPARFANWMEALNEAHESGDEQRYQRLLRMSCVKTVIELENDGVRLIAVDGEDRFQFYPCASPVRSASEALREVLINPEIGENWVVIEAGVSMEGCLAPSDKVSQSIRVLSESANRFRVEVRTAQKGWLVVKDTFYPGWTAWVNGEKKLIFPANSIFRAVQVEVGTNVVEIFYQPLSFVLGAVLSLLSLTALMLYRGFQKR